MPGPKIPESENTSLLSASRFRSRYDVDTANSRLLEEQSDDDTDESSEVDVDLLSLSLARIGGSFSGSALAPVHPHYMRPRPQHVSMAKQQYEERMDVENAPPQHHEEADVKADEEVDGDPRFINISPRRFWAVFAVIMLAYFVACFDSTLMASSHPVITSYFEASQAAPWLSTVFLITSTATQPFFGRLSDVIGRRLVFTLTLFIFSVTTLWCAIASSIESLIAARAVCGLGAGGSMALSLIIVSDLVRIEYRGVFQSYINVAFGLGSAAGAAFGGFLCDSLGWRWSFGVQVPLISICCIAAFAMTPASLGPMLTSRDGGSLWGALRGFDSQGSILLFVAITTLTLTLNLGGNMFPWISPVIIGCAVLAVASTAMFLWRETKAKHPLMPLKLLHRMPMANLVFSNFLGAIASSTVLFNVPLFFQGVLLTSASDSGFRLAIPSLAGSGVGVCTGYIITYTRKLKPTLTAGGILYLAGAIAILFMNRNVSELLSLVFIIGVPMGQGFVFPNTMMSALAISEQEEQAVVTTTIGLWRNLGMVTGVALSSLVFQKTLAEQLEALVTGPKKWAIIGEVRSSVESVKFLAPEHRLEVVSAYEASLRMCFVCALVATVIVNVLILPVKLPKLKGKVVMAVGE